jgi:hypothetical protein
VCPHGYRQGVACSSSKAPMNDGIFALTTHSLVVVEL